jgi:Undecaprenyl-phosphate glucose phosphotransferase
MTRRSINIIQFWLKVGFFSIPGIAFGLAAWIRSQLSGLPRVDADFHAYLALTAFVSLLWILVVENMKLDRIETLVTVQTGVNMAARSTVYCAVLAVAVLFFYRGISFARIFVVMGCLFIFVLSLMMIHLFRAVIHTFGVSSSGNYRIAILGADDFAGRVAAQLTKNEFFAFKIACFVAFPNQTPTGLDSPTLEWDRLDDIVEAFHCREVIVALPPHRFAEAQEILARVQHLCVPARLVLDLGEGVFIPERIFNFLGVPLIDVRPYPIDTVRYAVGKRAFDIVFSLVVLFIASPFFLIIALIIKLTSRGPVFFTQERVSLNGRRFKMLKFRTMFVQDSNTCNTRHTEANDPRVTKIGQLLRGASLDELPQFINVLKGDMSVVGPRPELTFFVQKFRKEIPWYMARHNVKCGITGWAQINGFRGSHTSIPQRIQCDLHYMRNWSMSLDLKIILLTCLTGFASRNAL